MKLSRRSFVGSIAALIGLGSVCDVNAFQKKLPAAPSVGEEFTLKHGLGGKYARVAIPGKYFRERRWDIISRSFQIISEYYGLNDNQILKIVDLDIQHQAERVRILGLDIKWAIKEHVYTIYKDRFEYNLISVTGKVYPIAGCKLGV